MQPATDLGDSVLDQFVAFRPVHLLLQDFRGSGDRHLDRTIAHFRDGAALGLSDFVQRILFTAFE